MARKEIDIGIEGNDGTGDSIRESFRKVNDNFQELYAVFGLGGSISFKNIDDTPDSYLGNAGGMVAVNQTETGIGFYKFISDALDNANTKTASRINNSVIVEFDDVDPATPDGSGTVKITILDPHIERDPDPTLTAPVDFSAVGAYSDLINDKLRNTSGVGDDINTLVGQWNATHSLKAPIDASNVIPSIGYTDDTYVNIAGDTMTGPLEVPAGATGNQVPRTSEVITRAGSEENRTMLDTLYLADHPNPIEGFGTPNGKDDLQAVTKLYVDTQGFSSATNIYVATTGDDNQTSTPAGQEGRAPQYAYASVNAAMRRAEEIIESTPFEPGPYVQTITQNLQTENSTIQLISGYTDWSSGVAVAAGPIVIQNVLTLQEEVEEFVETTFPDLEYDVAICKRDIKLILDSVRLDVTAGATVNYLSRWAGLRYNANPSAVKAKTTQLTATTQSIGLVKTRVLEILGAALTISSGDAVYDAYSDRFDDIISIINGTSVDLNSTGTGYVFQFSNGTYDSVDQGEEGNSDLREGKLIVGKSSGAKGIITDYRRTETGTTDGITVDLVEPIEFTSGEELEYGNLTRNNQVTVRVESGIYNEHLPIRLPENVSIKGDEFRRVVVRPKPGVSQSSYANTYFYRDAVIDGLPAALSPISTISAAATDVSRAVGTYNILDSQYSTEGAGIDATFTVVVTAGGVTTVTVTNNGDGFVVGDVITIADTQLGGGGAADLTFSITATGGGTTFVHPISGKNGKYGYHYLADPSSPINVGSDGATNPGNFPQAARLIEFNKFFIIEETIEFINTTYPSLVYTESKCRRDTGLIIDGIISDLKSGGREATLTNQGAYYEGAVAGQETETAAAITNLKVIIEHVLLNGDVSSTYIQRGSVDDITDEDYTAETDALTNSNALCDCVAFAFDAGYNPPLNNREMDVFLCNDATIVRNITVQRQGGFMMVLDPEGQILTRSPYCQTGSSFSQSLGTRRNFAGGLFIDGYAGNMPVSVSGVNSAFNIDVISPAGEGLFVRRPPTPFPFFYNGGRYQVNTITNYNKATGSATFVLDETSNVADKVTREIDDITSNVAAEITFTTIHPFNDGDRIQISNVNGMTQINGQTVYIKTTLNPDRIELFTDLALTSPYSTAAFSTYTGGGNAVTIATGQGWTSGTGIDIFVQSGGNRSMLANDFTQVNDLGYGCIAINNALSELVSMFTYYCHTGYLAADGSQIRSIAGNNSYGFYGLVAEGSDPDEIATDVDLAADMVFPAKTFRADGYLDFAAAVPSVGTIAVGQTLTQGEINANISLIDSDSTTTRITFASAHGLTTGDLITVTDVVGMTEINDLQFYVEVLSTTEIDIYTDSALLTPYDSSTNTAYSSGGEATRAANATGIISFVGEEDGSGNPTRIYVHTTTGTFDTSGVCTTPTSTTTGTPSAVETLQLDAPKDSLFMYAYDLGGFPNNVSEVEVYHDVNLYQPYEITNATDAQFTIGGYEIDTATAAGLSGTYTANDAVLQISKIQTGPAYQVRIDDPGTGAVALQTIVIPGTLLGGASPANDATVTIDDADGGLITSASVTGTPRVDDSTPIKSGIVWRFNFGTGLEGTASNGLQQDTIHDTRLVVRHKQNFLLDNFPAEDLPVRPSTAFQFVDDTRKYTYRTISFSNTITDGVTVGTDQRMVTFDANFRYIDLTLDRGNDALLDTETAFYAAATVNPNYTDIMASPTPARSGTVTMGVTAATTSTDGSRFLVISPVDSIDEARLNNSDMIFAWGGKIHQIDGYAVYDYPAGGGGTREVGVIAISDVASSDINYPALSGSAYGGIGLSTQIADGLVLKAGLSEGEGAEITVNISTTRATGHDMLDIGVGGFNTANYPERIYGEPFGTSAISTNDAIDSDGFNSAAQVQERNKGRVFTVMTDQDGFFRVGRFFTVDQGTGSVTFNAALVLTNIDGIGFKRGVRVNEFSNDGTFTDAKGDAVPTQTAVEAYINARLGRDRNGTALTTGLIPAGGGYLFKLGDTMAGTLNMGLNTLTGLANPDPAQPTDAVNIQYFEDNTDEINDIGDVTITGTGTPIRGDLLVFTGTDQESQNCTITGDIEVTYDPLTPNELEIGFTSESITNDDISPTAAIEQSKLDMNAATTRANASGITQADLGLASFDSANFTVTNGWVQISTGGVANAELANDDITIGTTTINLGGTSTSLAGMTGITFASGNIDAVEQINHTGNITGPANSGADNGVSIGASGNRYNTIWATTFNGTATEALYADLAENYLSDDAYEPGTVLVFGGDAEVTTCRTKGQTSVAGVVTTNPAHLMNSALEGDNVVGLALQGRVPCKVIGIVKKGDMLVTSGVAGHAMVNNSPGIGEVLGKAVGTKDTEDKGVVEIVVGRV